MLSNKNLGQIWVQHTILNITWQGLINIGATTRKVVNTLIGGGLTTTKGEFNKLGGAPTCICKAITIKPRGNSGNISTNSQGIIVVGAYLNIKINCTSQGFWRWNPKYG